jgi:hypothetical protein
MKTLGQFKLRMKHFQNRRCRDSLVDVGYDLGTNISEFFSKDIIFITI